MPHTYVHEDDGTDPVRRLITELERIEKLPMDDPNRLFICIYSSEGDKEAGMQMMTQLDPMSAALALIEIAKMTMQSVPKNDVN